MAPRPRVNYGQYYRTKAFGSTVCKAYTEPPFEGKWRCNLAKGITVGPVEIWIETPRYVTICVRKYWINIWEANWWSADDGVAFADLVPYDEVQGWRERGWREPFFLMKNPNMYRVLRGMIQRHVAKREPDSDSVEHEWLTVGRREDVEIHDGVIIDWRGCLDTRRDGEYEFASS